MILSHFNQIPLQMHLMVATRVFHYLKKMIDWKLRYPKSNSPDIILTGYIDSDWGGYM
jgi:hypothetical protein